MKSLLEGKRRLFSRIYSVVNSNLSYLLLLTGFFILIELAFFILCNDSYFYAFVFVSNKMHLPWIILPGIAFFIFSQLLVHVGYCLLAAWFAALMIEAFQIGAKNQLLASVAVWLAGIVTVMMLNSFYFPSSHFSQLCSVFLPYPVMGDAIAFALFCWAALLVIALVKVLSRGAVTILVVGALMPLWLPFKFSTAQVSSAATPSQPNIILVGVDSLRPDVLGFFSGEAVTPFMNQMLAQSTVFSEAVTPLARTYPSWVGILTGQYPLQTGVRTNLSGVSKIDLSQTLPAVLQRYGYETIYATDETRFSNIDNRFGFDSTITPPVGLNDFLLGTFNDFPLSNLLVNTVVGRWLFPYSYGNRPAYVTYDPDSFLTLLQRALLRDHQKPMFLAVHFCLPHHPYLYDRLDGEALTGQERYLQSVQRVDRQVKDFFALLSSAHLLDHAVVVLLSDHGEALELAGDRLTEKEAYLPRHHTAPIYYPSSQDKLGMNQSVGHGTDVLGLPQYHSLLAFRLYGLGLQRAAIVPGVVTLLDIKPTVLSFTIAPNKLGLHSHELLSETGAEPTMSLAPFIVGSARHLSDRMLFLESDYSPEALRTVYPETRKLLLEGADLFQINADNTRLTVKDQMVEMIIKSKQYAVIYGSWMLALYPQANHTKMPVLVNLKSGDWTTDLNTPFARTSPARAMQLSLQRFYGEEVSGVGYSRRIKS